MFLLLLPVWEAALLYCFQSLNLKSFDQLAVMCFDHHAVPRLEWVVVLFKCIRQSWVLFASSGTGQTTSGQSFTWLLTSHMQWPSFIWKDCLPYNLPVCDKRPSSRDLWAWLVKGRKRRICCWERGYGIFLPHAFLPLNMAKYYVNSYFFWSLIALFNIKSFVYC